MHLTAQRLDLTDFASGGGFGRYGNEGIADEAGEIGLRDCCGTGGGFHDGHTFPDPAITDAIKDE